MGDLLIRNVNLIDPDAGRTEQTDIYIRGGKFAEPFAEGGAEVLDCAGAYAAPPFIDSHVHVFPGTGAIGIDADKVGVQQGVMQVVDAGSCGLRDFDTFKRDVIDAAQTQVYFFLNISRSGLVDGLSELADMDGLMTLDELENFRRQHGERLVGLKVRMSRSVVQGNDVQPLMYASELARQAGLPLMIHIGNAPPELGAVLDLLRKGDIVTHVFEGKEGGVPYFPMEFKQAAQRGVVFDVGHGNASFSYETVPKVMDIHPIDYSISTDLYNSNYEQPVGSLMRTMSKFLPLGLPLEDVVRRVTTLPRNNLHMAQQRVQTGADANLTIFRVEHGQHKLVDSEQYEIQTDRLIQPAALIMNGKQVWSDGI